VFLTTFVIIPARSYFVNAFFEFFQNYLYKLPAGSCIRILGRRAVRLKAARQSLAEFAQATGRRVDSARVSVPKFGRSEAGKASYIARKQERFNTANVELQEMRESGTIKAKGKLIESPPAPDEIIFASEHILQRWAERGMGPMDAERIIRASKITMSQRNGTQTCYYSELGFVAVGQDGNVASIGPLDEGARKLLEVVEKHGIPH